MLFQYMTDIIYMKIKEEELVLTTEDQFFFFFNDPSEDQRELYFLCFFQKEGGDGYTVEIFFNSFSQT